MEVRNPFTAAWVAERYSAARPKIHGQVMDHVHRTLPATAPRETGLDIGCGTGLSAVALTDVAAQVLAVDISLEMLTYAPKHSHIVYVQASAEDLPFSPGTFDIVTIGCTFHWCRPADVLDEVRRILRPSGWLIIYDNGFLGPTRSAPELERWYRRQFRRHYPPPVRNPQFHPFMVSSTAFRVVASEYLQEAVPFTVQELATYLTTQSNVVAAVEQGKQTLEDVEHWLVSEVSTRFERSPGQHEAAALDFTFGGYVTYLRLAS